ncbi:MAG: apolipoprotein N-acyltransferase, partial [Gammaproteobacteria bacterium]|nr:apolipoprotein N-acyltransferase [Gammaproteobacteria bacterium]
RHLVPFGEYLPFRSVLGAVLDFLKIPMSSFSAGALAQTGITAQGLPVGVSICYEDAYASEVGRALPEAALLVNLSNDAWFGTSVAPPQHLQIARMRAIEASRYLVRATNNGISAVLNQHGVEIARIDQFMKDTATASVVPLAGRTPFTRFGNALVLLLSLGVLAAGFSAARRARR